MILFGNVQTYIPQTTLFTMPQLYYNAMPFPSIFQYNPFGSLTGGYNMPCYTPTPQGISSWNNPFGGWFNFSLPKLNFSDIWNSITTTSSNFYNSGKETVSNIKTNVKDFASRIVSGARKYLGYNEKDGSYKKFTNGRTEAWCADFATFVARENGSNIPNFSGVSQILDWGRKNNKFSTTAKAGDIVIFKGKNRNGKQVSHTGIVSKVENGKVYTIEGNTSDKVAERSYSLSDSRITGYVSVA